MSEVFQFFGESDSTDFGTVIKFKKKGFWSRILDKFKSEEELYDNKKEIELSEIFHGVS
jgi:hypothetical protein